MFMNVSVLPSQDLWALCFNRIYETCIQLKSDRIMIFYILCHQMVQYPAINGNADLEFLYTPQCKVCNSSYEFAVLSKNEIIRDFSKISLIPLYISIKRGLEATKRPSPPINFVILLSHKSITFLLRCFCNLRPKFA